MTDALVQFLGARLDEDERRAQQGYYSDTHWERFTTEAHLHAWQAWREHFPRGEWDVKANDVISEAARDGIRARITAHEADRADRTLREVHTKRELLVIHRPYVDEPGQACLGCAGGIEFERCPVVRLLALPYADHEAYRDEWRP
ncbi:DUF6221 family protein [Streptomyces sp. NPDC047939]|uniref:DUF6221 family protein n=1 Tax=Streptomyces sp. NPDC047939 TaxID=3155381 RepID=UPI0034239FC0